MKKILFVINSLAIGGSEKSLISLLSLLDYSKYEVDLIIFKKGEPFDRYIPKEVNILETPKYYQYLSGEYNTGEKIEKIKYKLCRYKCSVNLRINSKKKSSINSEQVLYKTQKKLLEKINKKYDIAIAYSQGFPTYFIVDKVSSKKKISWINCDYVNTIYDKNFDYEYYKKIDKIIVVSNTIRESISNLKLEYKEKLEVILDIVDPSLIEKMSKEREGLKNDSEHINILTVGRLVIHYKGYDLAIKAAKRLKQNGYKFKLYIVGDGPDKDKIKKLIIKNELTNEFILLGKKDNPYPYMRSCDIYVQPSRKEGFGLTTIEAKILKRPIVCTNFNTAKELINNNIDGLIVDISSEGISKGIERYITDSNFYKKIYGNLNLLDSYNSIKEINKINKLFE